MFVLFEWFVVLVCDFVFVNGVLFGLLSFGGGFVDDYLGDVVFECYVVVFVLLVGWYLFVYELGCVIFVDVGVFVMCVVVVKMW